MGFDISNSTIGVDEHGMKEALKSIQVDLIDDAVDDIKEGIEEIQSNLSNYWKGDAANNFKNSLENEYYKLKDYLNKIKEKLEIDLATMAANIGQADQDAADAIRGYSQNHGSSSATSHSTGGSIDISSIIHSYERNTFDKIEDMWKLKPKEKTDVSNELLRARGIDVDWHGEPNKFYDTIEEGIYRTGATITNYGTSALEGFSGAVEGVADAGAVVVTGAASIFTGAYDGITYAGSKITGKKWHSVTADMWEGTKAFVAQDMTGTVFSKIYDDTDIGNRMKESSYYYSKVRSAGKATGATQGIKAISVLSLTASGADPKKLPLFTIATATATGFGKSSQIAYQNDLSPVKAVGFAVENAAREGIKESGGQAISEFLTTGDKQISNKTVRTGPKDAIKNFDSKLSSSMYESAGIDYNPSKGTGDEVVGLTSTHNLRSGDFSRLKELNKEANNVDVN